MKNYLFPDSGLKQIKRMELSYQIWKFLKGNAIALDEFAEVCGVSVKDIQLALTERRLSGHKVKAICKKLMIADKALGIPPLDSAVFEAVHNRLALSVISGSDDEFTEAVKELARDYPVRELIRSQRWIIFLQEYPRYMDSVFALSTGEDTARVNSIFQVPLASGVRLTKRINRRYADGLASIIKDSKKGK